MEMLLSPIWKLSLAPISCVALLRVLHEPRVTGVNHVVQNHTTAMNPKSKESKETDTIVSKSHLKQNQTQPILLSSIRSNVILRN